ncbi:MAG TPA: hypothetical protein VK147_07325, partial [Candidatus Didemnitutus sp.]|nr:hypothetical protein [Candidatus Didemnitutus sp.]
MNALAQLPVRTRSLQLISNNNTNLIEHRAPDGILSNFTYTWPSAYPTNPTDNFLTSTPTGTLAWANYDGLFWRLDGNAPATAASFLGPTSAGVPLNLSTSNAVPGSIDFYIGPVAPANRRITLDNTSFNVGTIADPVATNLNGTLSAEGTALINTVGTANTTIGNVGIGGSTVTLNAGTTGNIILGGVATDATPTELLTITAGGQVRRSTMSGTAQEGLVYSSGAYRLGGSANTDSPFLTDRFVNVDGSDLTFTANVGAETPLTIVGGVNSGVVLAASAGGDIVMTGVDVDVASTDFLTLDGSNRVRRAPVAGTAQEGITYSANAYRLGGPLVTDSPFLTNRFVNIDGSNLTITSNGGANTPFVVTGTANSGVALNADGLGTLELTGTTNINVSGTANTTIGNTGVGATTVTLNAGTTGNIVLGGVVTDATPTEILTITATNEVRRSTLSGTAQEGIVFTTGAYRLGGAANTDNPFLTNRFVNIDASNLSFTSDGGASTTMLLTGGVNSGVAMTTAGTGTIAMTGPTDVTGATTINTTGAANTTIGNTVGGGAVSLNSSGVNPITIDVGVNTNNLVLNNIATDATPTELLTITAGGQVRRSTMSGTAQEGVVYTAGAYRLGGAAVTDNPFLTDRYVNVDGSDLTFTSNGGANTPLVVT